MYGTFCHRLILITQKLNPVSGTVLSLYTHCSCACAQSPSCVQLCNPMNVAFQALLSMVFSQQEYWSRLPFPSPGDFPNSGMEAVSCISCIGRWILYCWATSEAIYMCVCVCIYTHTYTNTHTHTHTYIHTLSHAFHYVLIFLNVFLRRE